MPNAGSQMLMCDLPIRFDTYKGCAHGCKYCFAQARYNIDEVFKKETVGSLRNFINHKRNNKEISWCDWDIPLHWGGLSDPFQPIDKKMRISYECLKVFAETQYPVVISTKGRLIADPEYLDLISRCKVIVQISALCSEYDKIEAGAPPFEERLEIMKKITKVGKKLIVRGQPYVTDYKKQILGNLSRFADAGAHGIVFEGIKIKTARKGFIKNGQDLIYPKGILRKHFEQLREEAHRVGLKFYSGENRLRNMGDSLTCCGIDAGDPDFIPNKANLNYYIFDKDNFKFTEKMKEKDTGNWGMSCWGQSTLNNKGITKMSYMELMMLATKDKNAMKIMRGED